MKLQGGILVRYKGKITSVLIICNLSLISLYGSDQHTSTGLIFRDSTEYESLAGHRFIRYESGYGFVRETPTFIFALKSIEHYGTPTEIYPHEDPMGELTELTQVLQVYNKDNTLRWQKIFSFPGGGEENQSYIKLLPSLDTGRYKDSSNLIVYALIHRTDMEVDSLSAVFVLDSNGNELMKVPFSQYKVREVGGSSISPNDHYIVWRVKAAGGYGLLIIDVPNKRSTLYEGFNLSILRTQDDGTLEIRDSFMSQNITININKLF